MGNVLKTCQSYAHATVEYVVSVGTKSYEVGNDLLDYISYNVGQYKPTIALATQCMDIPAPERDVIHAIVDFAYATLGILIHPFKAINDKKFCTHVYQTSFVFSSTGGAMAQHKGISMCEKVLIYIGKHSNKVVEPKNKRMTSTVDIDNHDYDLPIDLWYTLNMTNNKKLYFFIHVSVTRGYKGILFASDIEDNNLFEEIKLCVNDYYIRTLGQHGQSGQTINDL